MLDIIKNSQISTPDSELREGVMPYAPTNSQISMAPTADEFYKKNIEKKGEGELLQFLSFIVDDEEYALELSETLEVIKLREITEVPHAPLFIAGIISLRGEIIPVISLQKRLGLNPPSIPPLEKGGQGGLAPENRIILASHTDIKIGLIVDRIMGVVRVNPNDIESTSTIQQEADGEFIRGVVHHKDRLIILLNLPMLLKMEEV